MGDSVSRQPSRPDEASALPPTKTSALIVPDAAGRIPAVLGDRKNSSLPTFASFAIFA